MIIKNIREYKTGHRSSSVYHRFSLNQQRSFQKELWAVIVQILSSVQELSLQARSAEEKRKSVGERKAVCCRDKSELHLWLLIPQFGPSETTVRLDLAPPSLPPSTPQPHPSTVALTLKLHPQPLMSQSKLHESAVSFSREEDHELLHLFPRSSSWWGSVAPFRTSCRTAAAWLMLGVSHSPAHESSALLTGQQQTDPPRTAKALLTQTASKKWWYRCEAAAASHSFSQHNPLQVLSPHRSVTMIQTTVQKNSGKWAAPCLSHTDATTHSQARICTHTTTCTHSHRSTYADNHWHTHLFVQAAEGWGWYPW